MQKKNLSSILNLIVALAVIVLVLFTIYILEKKQGQSPAGNSAISGPMQSVAVLPFVSRGSEQAKDYFSDGLSDGILNALAHVKGLKVCAGSSSFQFRGVNINMKEAGRKLGVDNVLEGTYQLLGNRIQISAHLFSAERGDYSWSGNYDENIDDVFNLQDRIAEAVSKKLALETKEEDPRPMTEKPVPGTAYNLYLQGLANWNLRTPVSLHKAIAFYDQAIAIAPAFAKAYARKADCYTALGYASHVSPKESFPKAMEAAMQALQLDSTLAEPHASLGFYKFYYQWDWAAAEEEFRMAIALNPNSAPAYDYYSYYLTAMKRYEEAAVMLAKAAELDPLSVAIETDIGFSLYYARVYDSATVHLQHVLQRNPKFMLANLWLGRCYQAKKNFPAAIVSYQKALDTSPGWPVALAAIGHVYGVSNDTIAAKRILDTLHSMMTSRFVTAYGVALLYAGLGRKDEAFEWLGKAVAEKSQWMIWLRTDPRWETIRSDARFAKLVSIVGLPD